MLKATLPRHLFPALKATSCGYAIDTCHFGSSLTRDLPASVEKGQEREVLISVAFLLNNFLGTF